MRLATHIPCKLKETFRLDLFCHHTDPVPVLTSYSLAGFPSAKARPKQCLSTVQTTIPLRDRTHTAKSSCTSSVIQKCSPPPRAPDFRSKAHAGRSQGNGSCTLPRRLRCR